MNCLHLSLPVSINATLDPGHKTSVLHVSFIHQFINSFFFNFTFFHFRGDRVTWMCHQRNCRAVAVTPAEFDAASALGAVIDGRTHNHKKCPAKAEKLKVQQVFNKGYINQPLK